MSLQASNAELYPLYLTKSSDVSRMDLYTSIFPNIASKSDKSFYLLFDPQDRETFPKGLLLYEHISSVQVHDVEMTPY